MHARMRFLDISEIQPFLFANDQAVQWFLADKNGAGVSGPTKEYYSPMRLPTTRTFV